MNATEIRGVNFSMTPILNRAELPAVLEVRRSGRFAQVVSSPSHHAPKPKKYIMDQLIDDDIRSRCW